ncbi:MAG: MBL fold metallo-hydrolase [Chloroflexi bacterium]|nr:MBL fold metallo-hydrolase [Chloroflexota bacterium]MBU1750481.1 MBL fold metallo-hydrolase [Chloroflexota bacterium]
MHTITLGQARLTLLRDGTFWMDGGGLFGLVPRTLWVRQAPPDDLNRVEMALNCLLIEADGQCILVETGMGAKLSEREAGFFSLKRDGGLTARLAELGRSPADVDLVINTHLHNDHAGGNTTLVDGQAVPTFPRATYCVQRREWADALFPDERTRATYLSDNLQPIAGQVRLLAGDERLTPSVRCVVTRGHTLAHQSVLIESDGQRALFVGDLGPFAVHMERLAWITAFDTEPLETLETKRAIVRLALEDDLLLILDHDPRVPWGRLRERDGKLTFESATSNQ